MTPEMSAHSKVVITKVSGVAYAEATTGRNLGSSANEPNYVVPTGSASHPERVKRSHLRLVRN